MTPRSFLVRSFPSALASHVDLRLAWTLSYSIYVALCFAARSVKETVTMHKAVFLRFGGRLAAKYRCIYCSI